MKKQLKNILLTLTLLTAIPSALFGMQDQENVTDSPYEWVQAKDSTLVRFKSTHIPYIPTLQWLLAGEGHSAPENPIPLQVSGNALVTVKKLIKKVLIPNAVLSQEEQINKLIDYMITHNVEISNNLKKALQFLDCSLITTASEIINPSEQIGDDSMNDSNDIFFAQMLEESIEQKTQEKENKKRKHDAIIIKTADGECFHVDKDIAKKAKTLENLTEMQKVDDEKQNKIFTHAKAGIFAKFKEALEFLNISGEISEQQHIPALTRTFLTAKNYSLKKLCALAQEADYQNCPEIFNASIDLAYDKLLQNNNPDILETLPLTTIIAYEFEQKLRDELAEKYNLKKPAPIAIHNYTSGSDHICFINPDLLLVIRTNESQQKTVFNTINLITNEEIQFEPINAAPRSIYLRDKVQISPDGKTVASIIGGSSKNLTYFTIHDVTSGKILFQQQVQHTASFRYCHNNTSISLFDFPRVNTISLRDYSYTIGPKIQKIARKDQFLWSGNGEVYAFLKENHNGSVLYVYDSFKRNFIKMTVNTTPYHHFNGLRNPVLNYDGTAFAAGSDSMRDQGKATYIDLTKKTVKEIDTNCDTLNSFAFAKDNSFFITLASHTKFRGTITPDDTFIICLFDVHTGLPIKSFNISSAIINSNHRQYSYGFDNVLTADNRKIAFTRPHHMLFDARGDTTSIIDLETGECLVKNYLTNTVAPFHGDTLSLGYVKPPANPFENHQIYFFHSFDEKLIKDALQSLSLEQLLWLHTYPIHEQLCDLDECDIYRSLPEILQNIIRR